MRLSARAAGARIARLAAGDVLRAGGLSLEVLWPPARERPGPGRVAEDPNARSLVLLARWRRFEALLPAMDNAEEDRHVLAAALAVGAARIVTFNRSDFRSAQRLPM